MKNYLILLDGPKGAGKSTLSALLEINLPNTKFFGIDKERNLLERTGSIKDDNEHAFQAILKKLKTVFEQGKNAVIDCGVTERRLDMLEAMAKEYDLVFHKFSLTAPYDVLRSRVEERAKLKGKKFDLQRFDVIHKALQAKSLDGFCIIDSDKLTPQEMFEVARSKIVVSRS